MENYKNKDTKEGLILTKSVFNILLGKIIDSFKKKYNIQNYKESQLYGFGNFDVEKPSLKQEFETILKGYVNGKYLYNKSREASSGKPFIKISKEYRYAFFNYLGFKNIYDFIDQDFFTPIQKTDQRELLNQERDLKDYYYVCYYLGEDKKMNKGKLIIYRQWKTVEMIFIYGHGQTNIYSFFGNITHSEGFVFFDTKYHVRGKKVEGAKFIFFIGKSTPSERNFLIGAYSGYDKYENTIAGKMILKKFDSRDKMDKEASNKDFNPIFTQELNRKRLVMESTIKKNPLLFSAKSPYAEILYKISKKYIVRFYHEKEEHEIKLNIEKNHLAIKSLNDSLIISDDQINLLENGHMIFIDFAINGLFFLRKVSIYIGSFELAQDKDASGKFLAVDVNNNVISGIVKFKNIH